MDRQKATAMVEEALGGNASVESTREDGRAVLVVFTTEESIEIPSVGDEPGLNFLSIAYGGMIRVAEDSTPSDIANEVRGIRNSALKVLEKVAK